MTRFLEFEQYDGGMILIFVASCSCFRREEVGRLWADCDEVRGKPASLCSV